ncbi:MAG: HAD family phosphatase [bacterium]|nr:HAD family phosphatase [bacterium]
MIKTIIFDLGGVIVPLDFPRGYAAIGRLTDLPAEEIPKKIAATDLVVRAETGQIEPEAFYREISTLLGLSVTFEEFRELWSTIFPPHTLVPESMLISLANSYRLLLLSNTNAIHFPIIQERYGLLRHFEDFILSHEVGVMKPDAGIYRKAVARARCQAGECLFIDDVPANVDGAKQAGLDAILFTGEEPLRQEFRTRRIEL